MQPREELEGYVSDLFRAHTVLWYLDFYDANWDPQKAGPGVLSEFGFLIAEDVAVGKPLRLYASPETIQRQLYPVGSTFGEAAELEGVWLAQGRELYPVLMWRSLVDRPAQTTKVFVHLVAEDGTMLFQDDGVPVRWLRPVQTWQLDEQLLDAHTLPRPERVDLGHCTLWIGLYDPDTM